ncbi:MAG: single-stranded DNA-binding protein [Bdellovibrionales bacterium]|nr:single-stranded DNA-binding protein [Bdellovibrionales bacterium]
MRSLNRVTLMGNLGQAPELLQSKNGKYYVRLRVATSRSRPKEDGTWEDHRDWHSVFVWGKLAEICAEHMQKGCGVWVEGHLTYWKEDGNGQVFKSTITADSVNFWNLNRGASMAANLDNPEGARNHNAVAHPA